VIGETCLESVKKKKGRERRERKAEKKADDNWRGALPFLNAVCG